MRNLVCSRGKGRSQPLSSFTLVELITVIGLIAILAAITLAAASGVMSSAARSRAKSEIQAMSTALNSYKTDNAAYPTGTNFSGPSAYSTADPSSSGGLYQLSSEALYQALSGKTNYYDSSLTAGKQYMAFKTSQLGGYKPTTGPTYIEDPWSFSYGYYTGPINPSTAATPYTGAGFFDLWSTGGLTAATATNPNWTNTWLVNWQ